MTLGILNGSGKQAKARNEWHLGLALGILNSLGKQAKTRNEWHLGLALGINIAKLMQTSSARSEASCQILLMYVCTSVLPLISIDSKIWLPVPFCCNCGEVVLLLAETALAPSN